MYGVKPHNKQILLDEIPEDRLKWLDANTDFIFSKSDQNPTEVMPRYKRRKIYCTLFWIGMLLSVLLFCGMIYYAAISTEMKEKNKAGYIMVGAIFFFVICVIGVSNITNIKSKKYIKKRPNVDIRILKDGRIATVMHSVKFDSLGWPSAFPAKSNVMDRHQHYNIFFWYINIYNRVSQVEHTSDGIKVIWSGESYYIRGVKGKRCSWQYYYHCDIIDTVDELPNIINERAYLEECLNYIKGGTYEYK